MRPVEKELRRRIRRWRRSS